MTLPSYLPALAEEIDRRNQQRARWQRTWRGLRVSERRDLTEAAQLWAKREVNLPFPVHGMPATLREHVDALIGGGVLELRIGGVLPTVALRPDLRLPLYAETDHLEYGVVGNFTHHSHGLNGADVLKLYHELKSMDHSGLLERHVTEALRGLPTSAWIAWSEANRPPFADLQTLGAVRKRLCALLALCREEDTVSAVLGYFPGTWTHRPLPDAVDRWQIAQSRDPDAMATCGPSAVAERRCRPGSVGSSHCDLRR